MARPEVTGRKLIDRGAGSSLKGGVVIPPACFSVRSFCAAHHISQAMYFKMKAAGWAPQEMRVGSRILISFEAAERWRREREEAAAAS